MAGSSQASYFVRYRIGRKVDAPSGQARRTVQVVAIAIVFGAVLMLVIAVALVNDLRYNHRMKDDSAWPVDERRWTGPGASGGGSIGAFRGWGGGGPGVGGGGGN